jgi:rare lipoprotein A
MNNEGNSQDTSGAVEPAHDPIESAHHGADHRAANAVPGADAAAADPHVPDRHFEEVAAPPDHPADEDTPSAPGAGKVAGVLAALSLASVVGVAAAAVNVAAIAAPEETPPPPGALEPPKTPHKPPNRLSPEAKPQLDRSGKKRVGKASFYARMFAGRKMADGTPMRPTGDNAASRTLPLGTTAKVTNLATGKTAVVTIRDRGPYVAGRIVDLSPSTAQQIGLDHKTGVTRVEVAPITVPLPNGDVKIGDGVLEASNTPLPGNVRTP